MAEFDWWLLVLGLVVGGGLVYLVLAENARREADLEARELDAEASFISERLADVGLDVSQPTVADVLREHRAYLHLPPPDAIVSSEEEALEPYEAIEAFEAVETVEPREPVEPRGPVEPREPADPRTTREART
ncbi:MAG TPA: hypothetical protein VFC71_06410 [Candidatus Polarisedimenticolia bacterium]|nr:hypothetical protein [Candidatus Polarisedimenticolia bacterium]